jgi:hypothetical protein
MYQLYTAFFVIAKTLLLRSFCQISQILFNIFILWGKPNLSLFDLVCHMWLQANPLNSVYSKAVQSIDSTSVIGILIPRRCSLIFACLGKNFISTNLIVLSGKTDSSKCDCTVALHNFNKQHSSTAELS